MVAARTDLTREPHKSISLFLMDLKSSSEGIKIGPLEEKMGLTGAKSVSLDFEGALLPPYALLGELHQGLRMALSIMDSARVGAIPGYKFLAKLGEGSLASARVSAINCSSAITK